MELGNTDINYDLSKNGNIKKSIIYEENEERDFYVQDTWKAYNGLDDDHDGKIDFTEKDYNEGIYSITAKAIAVKDNVVVFIDNSLFPLSYQSEAELLADHYVNISVIVEQKLAAIPDINGDNAVLILITDIRDNSRGDVLGFFWPVHSVEQLDSGIQQYSMECEVIYLDNSAFVNNELDFCAEILSHELQHLIHFHYHPTQDIWLDEGLSVQTEDLCGFEEQVTIYRERFVNNPHKSLLYFDQSMESYGYSSLFIQYIIDHFGDNVLREIYHVSETGMEGVIQSLANNGYSSLSSSALFINFSLALWLQSPRDCWFNFSNFHKPLPAPEILSQVGTTIDWSVLSWGNYFKELDTSLIDTSPDQSLHFSFDTFHPFDTFNQHVLYYCTIITLDDRKASLSIHHWLLDPNTGDNEFLFTPINRSSIDKIYVLLTAYTGTKGGVIPVHTIPLSNGSLTIDYHTNTRGFEFPGYIVFSPEEDKVLCSSIRYYGNQLTEWTTPNTQIAIWRLMKQTNGGSLSLNLMDDLTWFPSGWSTDTIDLNDFASGDYFFELEFFDGSTTHFFNSDIFTIEHSTTKGDDLLFFLFIILVGLCTAIGYYLLKHKLPFTIPYNSIKPNSTVNESKKQKKQRLSKLEPLFYGKEKPNVDDIKLKKR